MHVRTYIQHNCTLLYIHTYVSVCQDVCIRTFVCWGWGWCALFGVYTDYYVTLAHLDDPPVDVSIAVMRTGTGDAVAIAAPSTIETGAEKGDAEI